MDSFYPEMTMTPRPGCISSSSRPRKRAAKKAAKRVKGKQPENEDPAADGDEEGDA